MGIPSFYKKLIQTIDGLISIRLSEHPDILAFDANCAIYHIHKKLQTSGVLYDPSNISKYEDSLIKETIKYFVTIIDEVKPTKGALIALDGVVPFAKILQQRRRRFKSIATKKEENLIKKSAQPHFDTNCITPGTSFMSKLNSELMKLSKSFETTKGIFLTVSTSDEFGEGEQKVMSFLRCNDKLFKSYVIYGLDADLIILSMLHSIKHKIQINLLREESEFTHTGSIDKLTFMDIESLTKSLYKKFAYKDQPFHNFVYDYIGSMNLLGNDFVPHSYSLKIKDEGIEIVQTLLTSFTKTSKPLMNEDFTYNIPILQKLFEELGKMEESQILKKILFKNSRTAGFFCMTSDPIEKELAKYNDSPLVWKADARFLDTTSTTPSLSSDWKTKFNKHILYDSKNNIDLYLQSLAFTMNYYIGNEVDNDFYYPYFYAPLFSDIKEVKEITAPIKKSKMKELLPIQQLICVLPEESFYLIEKKYHDVLTKYPVYWPKSFDYFSYGKLFMYECEPIIPILHSSTIRKIVNILEKEESEGELSLVQPLPSLKKLTRF
jgi:5'-3' exoribonuclease 1